MVANEAVGDQVHFIELIVEPHEPDEFLLYLETEGELAVHDTGHSMVVGQGMKERGFEP